MSNDRTPMVGVLALQGDVAEHIRALNRAGAQARTVKLPAHLDGLDGLIIPGGESTTMGKLMRRFKLLKPLQDATRAGLPVYGTCAGMILLSNEVHEAASDQPVIGGMNIAVERNAFGPQGESFETELDVPILNGGSFHAIFIRAPVIRTVGPGIEVLARLADNTPVAARQGSMLVSSFHPELTDDHRMHALFLDLIAHHHGERAGSRENPAAAAIAESRCFGTDQL